MQSNRTLARLFKVVFFFISILFAYFLIETGNLLIKQLPDVVVDSSVEQHYDKVRADQLQDEIESLNYELESLALTKKDLLAKQRIYKRNVELNSGAYAAALAARKITEDSAKNKLVSQTRSSLEEEREKLKEVNFEYDQHQLVQTEKANNKKALEADLRDLKQDAQELWDAEKDWVTLKVFIVRLIFLLPLLVIAYFLLKRYNDSKYWPFVYGWGYFALYSFFFELVPYLPYYGGYVRSIVGIIITFAVGRYAIQFLQSYLEKTRQLEKEDESVRRDRLQEQESSLEETFGKLVRGVCPSCDRALNDKHKFCVYCGLCIKKECDSCNKLQISFNQFCYECGEKQSSDEPLPAT